MEALAIFLVFVCIREVFAIGSTHVSSSSNWLLPSVGTGDLVIKLLLLVGSGVLLYGVLFFIIYQPLSSGIDWLRASVLAKMGHKDIVFWN